MEEWHAVDTSELPEDLAILIKPELLPGERFDLGVDLGLGDVQAVDGTGQDFSSVAWERSQSALVVSERPLVCLVQSSRNLKRLWLFLA